VADLAFSASLAAGELAGMIFSPVRDATDRALKLRPVNAELTWGFHVSVRVEASPLRNPPMELLREASPSAPKIRPKALAPDAKRV
jgi:hypothetical protein